MTTKDKYNRVHRTAKLIVCTLVILLLVLGNRFDSVYFEAGAVVVWFFGVNPLAYVLETVLHFKHKHSKI